MTFQLAMGLSIVLTVYFTRVGNPSGQFVIQPLFDFVGRFREGLAPVWVSPR
jgi:hypothetical protein